MIEAAIKKVKAIERCAEIIQEHWKARGFKNDITDLGIRTITGLCKEVVEDLEKKEAPEDPR